MLQLLKVKNRTDKKTEVGTSAQHRLNNCQEKLNKCLCV